ncbi:MAG: NADH-quinone oxidoreductase subunit C [Dehalococcoidia bacterium]|nr:NADH-quinone oxidoreductase subunit C [Dehalococcoidia bacterium]
MATATAQISGQQLAERIEVGVPGAIEETADGWVRIRPDRLVDVCRFLRDDRELDARYLNAVSGVDWFERFEVVYHLTSLSHNHTMALKVETDREQPEVPSVASVWRGAHLQEREIFDLLGIRFSDHPNLKRIFLWEGFPGYPLRKDFMSLPGGEHPGLQRFPKEEPGQWGGEFRGG